MRNRPKETCSIRSTLIRLGLLLGIFGIFTFSHIYYDKKAQALQETVVVEQYKMLDNKLFTLKSDEKNRALAQNASYEELLTLQSQQKSATKRSDMGFWVSVVFGLLSLGYFIYAAAYCYIYLELVKNEGYKKTAAWIREKINTQTHQPKDEE